MLDVMNGCRGNSCSCLLDGDSRKEKEKQYGPLGEMDGDMIAPTGKLEPCLLQMPPNDELCANCKNNVVRRYTAECYLTSCRSSIDYVLDYGN